MTDLFAGNADIKYPLSEFHETAVPNDLLLDLSLTLPPGYTPAMCGLRTGSRYAFLSIEDETTGEPIASVLVNNPVLGRVYPLDMHMEGAGWVVWGPGAVRGTPYFSGPVVIPLDDETFVTLQTDTGILELDLVVNENELTPASFLQLLSGSDVLRVTVEGDTIYIDRNDEALSRSDLVSMANATSGAFNTDPLLTLDGVPPDADGNIDIVVENCVGPCLPVHDLTVPRSNTGLGEHIDLPLDALNVSEPVTGYDCDTASSSAPSSTPADPFAGCQTIETISIHVGALPPVGVLFTVEGV